MATLDIFTKDLTEREIATLNTILRKVQNVILTSDDEEQISLELKDNILYQKDSNKYAVLDGGFYKNHIRLTFKLGEY